MSKNKKNRLGRGLDALISAEGLQENNLREIKVESIEPNPYQPRQEFSEDELEDLANSIRTNGVLQPIILTSMDDGYFLVAGERRWRAAKMAGLSTIPAIIHDLEEEQMMELALVENIHREDLNPLEEARAYQQLIDKFNITQAALAERLGKSRSTITNSLRLLNLSDEVQNKLLEGKLSAGQARALAGLDSASEQREVAETIIAREMNVREAEKLVSDIKAKRNKETEREDVFDQLEDLDDINKSAQEQAENISEDVDQKAASKMRSKEWSRLGREFSRITGLRTEAEDTATGGKLTIYCEQLEELAELVEDLRR
ncbi:MAG: ParB/RepB/Spo0J family partition protein [Bacillota bacterium]